jgi:hypothetical protein
MQSLSLSQQNLKPDTNETPELELDNLEADDENIPNSALNYQRTSAGLIALATSLSGPGSREPYDQIDKCTTWFTLHLVGLIQIFVTHSGERIFYK